MFICFRQDRLRGRLFFRSPAGPEETIGFTPNASRHLAELTTMRTIRTVSHSMKTQLDERRAAEFYEFAIPFEVAAKPASRESTGSIMNRSDDGRIIDLNRSLTGGVGPP